MQLTISEVKTYLEYQGTDKDNLFTMLLDGAISTFNRLANNLIVGRVEKTITKKYKRITDDKIYLGSDVDLNIKSFKVNNVDSEDYWVENDVIYLDGNFNDEDNIEIIFDCGYTLTNTTDPVTNATLPDDIGFCLLKMVGRYYNKHKSDGLTNESLDGASLNYEATFNDEIVNIISKYKIFVI